MISSRAPLPCPPPLPGPPPLPMPAALPMAASYDETAYLNQSWTPRGENWFKKAVSSRAPSPWPPLLSEPTQAATPSAPSVLAWTIHNHWPRCWYGDVRAARPSRGMGCESPAIPVTVIRVLRAARRRSGGAGGIHATSRIASHRMRRIGRRRALGGRIRHGWTPNE